MINDDDDDDDGNTHTHKAHVNLALNETAVRGLQGVHLQCPLLITTMIPNRTADVQVSGFV